MQKISSKELLLFIKGDIKKLSTFNLLSSKKVSELYNEIEPVIVTKKDIYRVLIDFKNGLINRVEIQQWASFIRRGYFSTSVENSTSPINLNYDILDEEIIVEVISRLDELGHKINGEITKSKINKWLKNLAA